MSNVKETVIQFGEGGFLRGFVDYFFQKMKDKGLFDGSVVVVQPIERGMCDMLQEQNCEYNLFLRGIDKGQVVDEHTHISVISRCVNPYTDCDGYMALAENPDFRLLYPTPQRPALNLRTIISLRTSLPRHFPES